MIISLTRLRLARPWHIFKFMRLASAAVEQARQGPACVQGATYAGPLLAFWTATVWTDEAAMRAYVCSGAHRDTLRWLPVICSEAATAHVVGEHIP